MERLDAFFLPPANSSRALRAQLNFENLTLKYTWNEQAES